MATQMTLPKMTEIYKKMLVVKKAVKKMSGEIKKER